MPSHAVQLEPGRCVRRKRHRVNDPLAWVPRIAAEQRGRDGEEQLVDEARRHELTD
jgi:hypothetical protein